MTREEGHEELGLNQADVKDIAREAYLDPVFFCKYFLEDLFPGRVPWVHKGLLAILGGDPYEPIQRVPFLEREEHKDDLDKIFRNFIWQENPKDPDSPTHSMFGLDDAGQVVMRISQYLLIMMPRGFAKTTIAGIAIPLKEIVYQENPLSLYVSETGNHAKMQLSNVRRELVGNKFIRLFFGDLKPKLSDEQRWAGDLFETTTGMAMIARGRGGQIRGLNHHGYRPRKILVDDLEDMESVATTEQREKTRKWAYSDLMPALPKVKLSGGRHPGRMTALGTLRHPDALLEHWRADIDKWRTVCFGAEDIDGDPIWAENMTKDDLEREKLSFAAAGLLTEFHMEYYNKIVLSDDAAFKPEYFHISPPLGTLTYAVYIDPAISDDEKADETVIIVAAMSTEGRYWIIDGVSGIGMDEREKTNHYFNFHQKYNCRFAGVEGISYQRSLEFYFREEMFRRNYFFEIELIKWRRTKKYEHIRGTLSGRYANGFIHHAKQFPKLMSQLLDLRPGVESKDDWADAAAGVIKLFEPLAPQASPDISDTSKDQYVPLDAGYFPYSDSIELEYEEFYE